MIEFSIQRHDIFHAFEKLNIGRIERIDIIYNDITHSRRAFIHFIRWNNTSTANEIQQILLSGTYIKLVYQFPWFWKCYKSTVPKPYF